MSEQAVETLIGIGVLSFVIIIAALFYYFKYTTNRYEELSKEQRMDARDREEKLQSTLDNTIDRMGDITKSLQEVNQSVARQTHETNMSINAINQTTMQLGSTVSTLSNAVDRLDKTTNLVVPKVNTLEERMYRIESQSKQ